MNPCALQPLSLRGAPSGCGPGLRAPRAAGATSPVPPAVPQARAHRPFVPLLPGPRSPAFEGGRPSGAALTRAELPAGAGVCCAAQTGVGAGRARAAPMPAPRRDRVRAGGDSAPATSGPAPRASRGPPAPPPPSGKPRARGPPPAHPARAPCPRRTPPARGGRRGPPLRWARAARQHSRVRVSAVLLEGRPRLPRTRAPSPFPHRESPGLGCSLLSEPGSQLAAHKDQVAPEVRTRDAGHTWHVGTPSAPLNSWRHNPCAPLQALREFLGEDRAPSRCARPSGGGSEERENLRSVDGSSMLCLPRSTRAALGSAGRQGLGSFSGAGWLVSPPASALCPHQLVEPPPRPVGLLPQVPGRGPKFVVFL